MIRELEFKILCQRHCDEIFRYALGLLGNRADAEDATQEVLLRVWDNLPKVNLFHARAWILRTTRNHCLDQIRRRSNQATPILVDDELLNDQPDHLALDPSDAADSSFRLEQAHAALIKLPEKLRSVFLLYEVNGLRYREIAQALDIPLNTVRVYLSRARAKLAELIRKEEPWTRICND
ncbi:MAG: RNA polymerase sigma factor [Verrucomicrobiia bacterium]